MRFDVLGHDFAQIKDSVKFLEPMDMRSARPREHANDESRARPTRRPTESRPAQRWSLVLIFLSRPQTLLQPAYTEIRQQGQNRRRNRARQSD